MGDLVRLQDAENPVRKGESDLKRKRYPVRSGQGRRDSRKNKKERKRIRRRNALQQEEIWEKEK